MPRLPLKKTEKLAEKQAYGETLGKLKAIYHFKFKTKKGWLKSLREHLGKWIDNINPVETFAILGLTFLIKQIIVENFEDRLVEITIPYWVRLLIPDYQKFERKMKEAMDKPQIEMVEWLISFTIAYVIIKHGGALFTMMGEGAKSLTSIVGLFFGR